MPGSMDGIQFALNVRQEQPELPITVITGFAENIQGAVDAGLDVVQEPLDFDELSLV